MSFDLPRSASSRPMGRDASRFRSVIPLGNITISGGSLASPGCLPSLSGLSGSTMRYCNGNAGVFALATAGGGSAAPAHDVIQVAPTPKSESAIQDHATGRIRRQVLTISSSALAKHGLQRCQPSPRLLYRNPAHLRAAANEAPCESSCTSTSRAGGCSVTRRLPCSRDRSWRKAERWCRPLRLTWSPFRTPAFPQLATRACRRCIQRAVKWPSSTRSAKPATLFFGS